MKRLEGVLAWKTVHVVDAYWRRTIWSHAGKAVDVRHHGDRVEVRIDDASFWFETGVFVQVNR